MHNSIGIITWEKLCLIYHHMLFRFPYRKEGFLQLRNLLTKQSNHYTVLPPEIQSATPEMFGLLNA